MDFLVKNVIRIRDRDITLFGSFLQTAGISPTRINTISSDGDERRIVISGGINRDEANQLKTALQGQPLKEGVNGGSPVFEWAVKKLSGEHWRRV